MILTILGFCIMALSLFFVGLYFHLRRKPKTWLDRGEARGRTHSVKAEPVASLHIKVTRADGRVEEYTEPATIVGRK